MIRINWNVTELQGGAAVFSATLSDPTGAWGVRRLDTLDSVVEAGTPLAETSISNGMQFTYEFAEPEPQLEYEYYIKVVETVQGFDNTYYVNGRVSGAADAFDPHTLGGVRRLLVDISGRADLVRDAANGDYANIGLANFYINEGQRWLDRRLPHHKTVSRLYKTLAAEETMVTFEQARSVREVYEVHGDGSLQPLPWSSLNVGLAPDQMQASELPAGARDVVLGAAQWPLHAVYVAPADRPRNVLVSAAWYCPRMTQDSDRSYWTVQHPLLLVHATMLLFEIGIRNTQGVNDFFAPIKDDLQRIYFDLVEEEVAKPPHGWRM